jgi:hypothetical protein
MANSPPTFVQEAESSYNATAVAATTAAFAASTDNLLLALSLLQVDQVTAVLTNSGAGLTWTREQTIAGNNNNSGAADIWSTVLLSDVAAQTVTVTVGGGGFWQHGVSVTTWADTLGAGASSRSETAAIPSVSLTTTEDNSAILVGISDFFSVDGSSRAWKSVNGSAPVELTYFRQASAYTGYMAYYADVGTAGAKSVGLSAPGSQKAGIVAIEILGMPIVVVPEQTDLITLTAAT